MTEEELRGTIIQQSKFILDLHEELNQAQEELARNDVDDIDRATPLPAQDTRELEELRVKVADLHRRAQYAEGVVAEFRKAGARNGEELRHAQDVIAGLKRAAISDAEHRITKVLPPHTGDWVALTVDLLMLRREMTLSAVRDVVQRSLNNVFKQDDPALNVAQDVVDFLGVTLVE
jgi:hypothetical protein